MVSGNKVTTLTAERSPWNEYWVTIYVEDKTARRAWYKTWIVFNCAPWRNSKCCATLNGVSIGCLDNGGPFDVHFPAAQCSVRMCNRLLVFCLLLEKHDVSKLTPKAQVEFKFVHKKTHCGDDSDVALSFGNLPHWQCSAYDRLLEFLHKSSPTAIIDSWHLMIVIKNNRWRECK